MDNVIYFFDYLEYEKNCPKTTIDSYRTDIQQFADFVNHKSAEEITQKDITDFIAAKRKEGIAVRTTNRKLSAIKSYFKFLVKKNYIEYSPADTVELSSVPSKLPETLNIEDIFKIIDVIDNLRDVVIIELLFATGIRRNELTTLKVSSIDFNEGTIKVYGKGSKERIIPVHPKVMDKLSKYVELIKSEWLFPSPRNKKTHISSRQINSIIKKWAEEAGLGHKNITPHKFRHTFGASLFDNGADIKSIQDMLGHSSIDTTNIYAKLSHKRNKEEYMKYHPISKEGV